MMKHCFCEEHGLLAPRQPARTRQWLPRCRSPPYTPWRRHSGPTPLRGQGALRGETRSEAEFYQENGRERRGTVFTADLITDLLEYEQRAEAAPKPTARTQRPSHRKEATAPLCARAAPAGSAPQPRLSAGEDGGVYRALSGTAALLALVRSPRSAVRLGEPGRRRKRA